MTQPLSPFFKKLEDRCQKVESNLCVGLDPDPAQFPAKMGSDPESIFKFCVEIVGATHESAAAFKPNMAFFESIGVDGWDVLSQVIETIPRDIPIIIDAKRGDIGSTAAMYAKSIFNVLRGDAVTLNPLLGHDSLKPFLDYADRGHYILCITSNPGAEDFQTWFDLYVQIAKRVVEWNKLGNCGLVVGGTQSKYLSYVRQEAPTMPLLIPGIGAQGGEVEALMRGTKKMPRHYHLINVSRSILYASQKPDFARAARKEAMAYRDRINKAIK